MSYRLPSPTCHTHFLLLCSSCLSFMLFISGANFVPGLGRTASFHPISLFWPFLHFHSSSLSLLFFTLKSLCCISRLGGACFDQVFVLRTLGEFSSSNPFSPTWFVCCCFIFFFFFFPEGVAFIPDWAGLQEWECLFSSLH